MTTNATANWHDVNARCTTLYLEKHKEDMFLVILDRGRGAGHELDTMKGKHIALRLSVSGTSLHMPKVLYIARIYDVTDMLKEDTNGYHSPHLL